MAAEQTQGRARFAIPDRSGMYARRYRRPCEVGRNEGRTGPERPHRRRGEKKEIAIAALTWRLSRHLEDAGAADDLTKHGSRMGRKPDGPVAPRLKLLPQQPTRTKQRNCLTQWVHFGWSRMKYGRSIIERPSRYP